MCDTQAELLVKLEKLRAKNNRLWMGLVKIAVQSSDPHATLIMDEILRTDKEISGVWAELAKTRKS